MLEATAVLQASSEVEVDADSVELDLCGSDLETGWFGFEEECSVDFLVFDDVGPVTERPGSGRRGSTMLWMIEWLPSCR